MTELEHIAYQIKTANMLALHEALKADRQTSKANELLVAIQERMAGA